MSNPSKKRRHKKRRASETLPGSSFSKSMRTARDLIGAGWHEDGLQALNSLASTTRNPKTRGRIALMIGESQTLLSRHQDAASAYQKAGDYGRQAGDVDLMFDAGLGEVRSLLRSLRTDEAKVAAASLLDTIGTANQALADVENLSLEELSLRGSVELPARPPRLTVVLTRLASAFIESGMMADARAFLEKAIVTSPNGASRARQILARLALATDEPAQAETFARESLQMGRFQAKTVAAWPLYLSARARQNSSPVLEPVLLQSLTAHASGRIFAVSILAIIKTLRTHGDDGWREIATKFVKASPSADGVVVTEVEKILQADARLTISEEPSKLAARARRLFRASDVSPEEQIAHIKAHVRYSLEAELEPDLERLIERGVSLYGQEHGFAMRHSAAHGARLAGRHDLARTWLEGLVADADSSSAAWGRAKWVIARIETETGNKQGASSCYLEIAANPSTPSRFRVQSLLRGFRLLQEEGSTSDINRFKVPVTRVINSETDFRVVLDIGRQLALSGSAFETLTTLAERRGCALADRDLNATTVPRSKLAILEYASRKLAWDFKNDNAVLERWYGLNDELKAEFKAVGGSLWYEYVSVVFVCMTSAGRERQAIELASSIIDGPSETPEGYVIVGSEYASWLVFDGNSEKAFPFFEWIALEQPTHRRAACAHHWLALRAYKAGALPEAGVHALAARKCFAPRPSLEIEWIIDVAAMFILCEGRWDDTREMAGGAVSPELFRKCVGRIEYHLSLV